MNYEKKNYENTLFPAVTYPYPDGAASNLFLHTDDTEVNEGNYTYTLNRPGAPSAPESHMVTEWGPQVQGQVHPRGQRGPRNNPLESSLTYSLCLCSRP